MADSIILLDFETTGLLEPEAADLSKQPHVIEIGAMRLDWKTLKESARMDALVKPPIPISEEITKITGITDDDVKKAPPFVAFYPEMLELFLGARWLLAHNCPYDRTVLGYELRRLGRELRFPWPPNHLCSVELTRDITGKDLHLYELYAHVTGKDPAEVKQTHRGIEDVEMLYTITKWLRKTKRI